MIVTLNWLKDYVDIDCSVEVLAEKLVSAGFEVEEITKLADACKGVVVGRIESLSKHPDADKLQICDINIGKAENVQIVTGADNVSVGDLVPVATDGSSLPNGMNIKKGKLRGVMSYGMLCSGGELKLSEQDYVGASIDGIMLLKQDCKIGTDINTIIGNDDIVMDISVTANRPDCNSIFGIAREIATLLNKPIHLPSFEYKTSKTPISDMLSVTVNNSELCPRYMAGVVSDIVIKQSPSYIQKRLKAIGLRAINNIVDITNYVLMEIGQPMHAFDYSHVGGGKIVVRTAENETIKALDDKEYLLDSSVLIIADENKPSAIGGIMGGIGSGIMDSTTAVVFESANFKRENIRRTSRKLNLRSDSSARYERGIDLASQELGLKRALALIYETQSGTILDGVIDECSQNLEQKVVVAEIAKIDSILGITVPRDKMVEILSSLQIKTILRDDKLVCTVPLYREDIENENDLAEEIIRLYGYNHIRCDLLAHAEHTRGGKNTAQKNIDFIKNYLVDKGLYQTLTYSFISPKMYDTFGLNADSELRQSVKILNPLGEDVSIMRTTLAYSLLEVVSKNLARNNKDLGIFEVANVYNANEIPIVNQPKERLHLCFAMCGNNVDFYKIKAIIKQIIMKFGLIESYSRSKLEYLHNGISADITVCGDKLIGSFGEVHPKTLKAMDIKEKVYLAELDIEMMNCLYDGSYEFKALPKFPTVERDIAVVVEDTVTAEQLLNVAAQAGGKMLLSCEIFDVYNGKGIEKGFKSVAIKIKYQATDRTLTDEEINTKIDKTLRKLESELGAKLR